MRQLLMNTGGVVVARMPRPALQPGMVLIRVCYSLVSVGTELAPLRAMSAPAPDTPTIERIEHNLDRVRLLRHYLRASLRDPRKAARRLAQIAERRLVQAREATADMADNMEAMKHNFLLRGFFNRRGYYDLDAISPVEYRKGVLENGKRKAMRTWLGANVLFEPGPEGTEVLSQDGRARLDSAMATYLKYVPSNPIVVEGYATMGTTDERFRQGRIRAGMIASTFSAAMS